MTQQKISVVSPCYNEALVISDFYAALKSTLSELKNFQHEIILVDDGSHDGTSDILKQLALGDQSLKVILLSRNFGHQMALSAGIDHASGDTLIMMDSDFQHPVHLIPSLIEEWNKGFDVVSMVRRETAGAGFFKRFSSKLFYILFNKLSLTALPMGAADFCLLSRPVYAQLKIMQERHRFLRGLVSWLGFNRKLIPYTADMRKAGVSKYSMTKMVRLASEAIFSFSSKPLTMAIRMGLFLTAGGFVYLFYILYGFFFNQNLVPGWASLICSLLILNGFQLISIGLIGEYIAKIFEEVKARPVYVIKERLNIEPVKS